MLSRLFRLVQAGLAVSCQSAWGPLRMRLARWQSHQGVRPNPGWPRQDSAKTDLLTSDVPPSGCCGRGLTDLPEVAPQFTARIPQKGSA